MDKICVAYDGLNRFFPEDKILKTGNPVRQDLLEIPTKRIEALNFFKLDVNKKTLLVLGGSLGARAINQLIANNIEWIETQDIQLIWQTGKLYINEYKQYSKREAVQTHAFLNKMDLAYAAADFIISRAGAGSISELCMVGKPVIFVPSPNVTEDHQTKNAQAVVEKKAALLLKESELDTFQSVFGKLLKDVTLQNNFGVNIKKLELPKATQHIADEVKKLVKNS